MQGTCAWFAGSDAASLLSELCNWMQRPHLRSFKRLSTIYLYECGPLDLCFNQSVKESCSDSDMVSPMLASKAPCVLFFTNAIIQSTSLCFVNSVATCHGVVCIDWPNAFHNSNTNLSRKRLQLLMAKCDIRDTNPCSPCIQARIEYSRRSLGAHKFRHTGQAVVSEIRLQPQHS